MLEAHTRFERGRSDNSSSPAFPVFRRRSFFPSVFLSLTLWAVAGSVFAGAGAVLPDAETPETETQEAAGQRANGRSSTDEDGVTNDESAAIEPRTREIQLAGDEKALAAAEATSEAANGETDSEAAAQGSAGAAPLVDFNVRFRGRVLDEFQELGDPEVGSFSIWSKTKIGDRIVTNITYDLGKTRMHDFWVQFDVGGGLQVRAGRSSLAWLGEFTESSHSRQMVYAAVGSSLTRSREVGVFLFADRGPYNARLHVVQGSGYEADNNSSKDMLASVGRTFDVAGSSWLVDAGHYEGRDGPDDALVPRRQTGVHVDGVLGSGQVFRGAAFRREQHGREHLGGFARLRHRLPQGIWAAAELGTETNHGPLNNPGHSSYLIAGARYELPWNMTHLSADYRWRFGATGDHELLLLFQWLFDFQNSRRN